MSEDKDKISKAFNIGADLSPAEHERFIKLIRKCIGEENLLVLAASMQLSYFKTFQDHKERDIENAAAILTSMLLILYLQGSIMFRNKEG